MQKKLILVQISKTQQNFHVKNVTIQQGTIKLYGHTVKPITEVSDSNVTCVIIKQPTRRALKSMKIQSILVKNITVTHVTSKLLKWDTLISIKGLNTWVMIISVTNVIFKSESSSFLGVYVKSKH